MNMTPEQVTRFKEVLEKVNTEEKRATEFARKLRKQLDELKDSKLIDDYNFQYNLRCFSFDEKVNKKFNVEEGDPIFDTTVYCLPIEDYHDYDENFNWNQHISTDGTPLEELFFSYAMHCICWHSDLEFEDILAISDVWIEIKIDYQFWTDKQI
jgi:hypothetical protein